MWRRPPRAQAPVGGVTGCSLDELLRAPEALVTIGGVAFGGLGKSEVALWLAEAWEGSHLRGASEVALLCHGYRGNAPRAEEVQLPAYEVITEAERREAVERWGDEAVMMRWRAPDVVRVWAGGSWEDRIEVSGAHGARLRVCDGALYRHELTPNAQVCIFDPSLNPRLFPFGSLTRPLWSFPSAVSWWAHGATAPQMPRRFERCAPLIARSRYLNAHLITPHGERVSSELLHGREVEPWLGVSRPQRFLSALSSLGATLRAPVITRDHGLFSKRALRRASRALNPPLRVCSYKDLPRIPRSLEVYVLEPTLSVEAP